jgi:hypothetical protein
MARLRTDLWVAAYLRQRSIMAMPAVLRRRGAAEAGVVFVRIDRLDGRARLYGPALPSASEAPADGGLGERRFRLLVESDALSVEDRIARELRFDGDLWLLEVDDPAGEGGLEIA